MHSDKLDFNATTPDGFPASHRAGRTPKPQTDGRKPIPHIITGLLAVAATLAIGHFAHVAQGPAGAPGTTTVITKPAPVYGFCLNYNYHLSGAKRVQLSEARSDKNGLYCPNDGKLITALPGT